MIQKPPIGLLVFLGPPIHSFLLFSFILRTLEINFPRDICPPFVISKGPSTNELPATLVRANFPRYWADFACFRAIGRCPRKVSRWIPDGYFPAQIGDGFGGAKRHVEKGRQEVGRFKTPRPGDQCGVR